MNALEKAEALLRAVSAEFGPPLEFLEGECTIEHDGGQEVSIQVDEASSALMLYAPLTSAGHHDREALFAWLLELNLLDDHLRGAVVGLDRMSDFLVLRYRLPLEGTTAEDLSALIFGLFEVAGEVNAAINEFLHHGDSDAPDDAATQSGGTSADEADDPAPSRGDFA